MVYVNSFSVKVIAPNQDKLNRNGYNYVALNNGTEYKLNLINNRSTDAMAQVFLEGNDIGTWFIPANSNITIDRPSNIARKFTFFTETDYRAQQANVIVGDSSNGLIKVIFYPKKQYISTISTFYPISPYRSSFVPSSLSIKPSSPRSLTNEYKSGATVLGSNSDQTFGKKERFRDDEIDWDNKTEIVIRLIVKQERNKYIPVSNNNIPPRIENYIPFVY